MKAYGKQQLWLAVCFLGCAVVALRNTWGFEGTEFSGGWLTGRLLSMANIGAVLLLLALVVAFVYPRIAGAVGLASSLLCLPLYLYFIAPVPFNRTFGFGHEFKSQPLAGIHWDRWALTGVLTIALTAYVCLRGFAVNTRAQLAA